MIINASAESSAIVTSISRYWYGLPQAPAGQYAWRRQLDAVQEILNLFLPYKTPERVDTPYYVELRALSLLSNDILNRIGAIEDYQGAWSQFITDRLWPTSWAAVAGVDSGQSVLVGGEELIGRLLDIVA